jgi:RTX calcium-binding nonapeptide repeat (4 copies)/WD40-like Beta Propeller Repeat
MRIACGVLMIAAFAVASANASKNATTTLSCPLGVPAGAFAPTFAPDGKRLAFAQPMSGGTSFGIGTAAVTGRLLLRRVADLPAPPSALAWSPRDDRIAYTSGDELHVVGVADQLLFTGAQRLGLGGWMPDASALVVSSGRLASSQSYLVDATTGAIEPLGQGEHAVPSPDGTRIALVSTYNDTSLGVNATGQAIDVLTLATGTRRVIFHWPALIDALAWSPDSKQVAFLWNIDVEPDLMAQNADGSSTGLFGRSHGALPTQIGMKAPFSWTARGIVGSTIFADLTGQGIDFYNPRTGKDGTTHQPFNVDAPFVAVSPEGRTIAYVARPAPPISDVPTPGTPGLRLVDWGGKNDRPLLPCRGTAGSDTITGSTEPDHILAAGGNDTIDVRGGGIDSVDCGPGHDHVLADKHDRIGRSCEYVKRSS